MFEALLTWEAGAAVVGVVLTAFKARQVRKAADQIGDVFEAFAKAREDGRITVAETRILVKEISEAASAAAPVATRIFGFIKKIRAL